METIYDVLRALAGHVFTGESHDLHDPAVAAVNAADPDYVAPAEPAPEADSLEAANARIAALEAALQGAAPTVPDPAETAA